MTTWFVHDCNTLLDVDQYNRWCNKWQSMIKGAGLWWELPSLGLSKHTDLSQQDAGQSALCCG